MSGSYWRGKARAAIESAHKAALDAGVTDRQMMVARIDAAYPFGPRGMHPYKCWLLERREWLERQGFAARKPNLTKRQRELSRHFTVGTTPAPLLDAAFAAQGDK